MEKYLEKYPCMLSVSHVSEILGVTENTVRRLINENKLEAIKVGRLFRVPKDKLISYLNAA